MEFEIKIYAVVIIDSGVLDDVMFFEKESEAKHAHLNMIKDIVDDEILENATSYDEVVEIYTNIAGDYEETVYLVENDSTLLFNL